MNVKNQLSSSQHRPPWMLMRRHQRMFFRETVINSIAVERKSSILSQMALSLSLSPEGVPVG